jgi:hypothetical protein
VSDVLDVSRIVAGKMRLNVRGRLAGVVQNALDVVGRYAAAKRVEVGAARGRPGRRAGVDRLQRVL